MNTLDAVLPPLSLRENGVITGLLDILDPIA